MKKEAEINTDQDASACSVPDEIVCFFRNYFMGEKTDPETMLRAELLAKTLIKFMLQLYRLGIEDEFQPIFFACNYVKPHSDEVTEIQRTYETIGGEPYSKFNLSFLTEQFETANKKWFKETFGVELSDKAADILTQWGGIIH